MGEKALSHKRQTMKLDRIRINWSETIKRWLGLIFHHLIEKAVGGWIVPGAITCFFLAIFGVLVITAVFIVSDMLICVTSSVNALKSWGYGAVIGVFLLYPYAGKLFNLAWFYSELTGYPASGPDALGCLNEYKYERYATDPNHEIVIQETLRNMDFMDSQEKMQAYINQHATGPFPCHVTGEMVWKYSRKYSVDARLMLALMHVDSHFGTAANRDGSASKAVRTKNPGNVGNDDSGKLNPRGTWEDGVEEVARWLDRNRKVITSELNNKTVPHIAERSFFYLKSQN